MNSGYGYGYAYPTANAPTNAHHDHDHGHGHATAMQALESAVALPGVFTRGELQRTLRRTHGDVMRAALQLRDAYAFRRAAHYESLSIASPAIQTELRKGYAHFLEHASDGSETRAPLLLLLLRHFKPQFQREVLQRQGLGASDGSSSLEDTRRLCVYMMDLAVEAMEENAARQRKTNSNNRSHNHSHIHGCSQEGIVFLVDLAGCGAVHAETQLVTDVLAMMRQRFPEVVRRILVLHANALTRGLLHVLLRNAAGEATRARVQFVSDDLHELRQLLPLESIPEMYGGSYRLMPPPEWIKLQAEVEGVDLSAGVSTNTNSSTRASMATTCLSVVPDEKERQYMTAEARQLNGMQYAACSVDEVVQMQASVLRGPLFRNKSGLAWVALYGILRPEALLLYESVTAKMPQIIIPVNHETGVTAAVFAGAPRGSFGFRIDVPGVAGGHLLAVSSEAERGNWLQELQMSMDAARREREMAQKEEEEREQEERAFAKMNMISFDDDCSAGRGGGGSGGKMAPSQMQQQDKRHEAQPAVPVGWPAGQPPPMAMGMTGPVAGYGVGGGVPGMAMASMISPAPMGMHMHVPMPMPMGTNMGVPPNMNMPMNMGMGMHMRGYPQPQQYPHAYTSQQQQQQYQQQYQQQHPQQYQQQQQPFGMQPPAYGFQG